MKSLRRLVTSVRQPFPRPTRAVADLLERRIQLSAPGSNWSLNWNDEFSGSALDTSKWQLYVPWTNPVTNNNRYHHNAGYASYMMPDDVSVSGGTLKLTTQQRNVTVNGTTFNYTEGAIHSNATKWFQHGYYEIRASLPTGGGNWPAFWMLGNGWPPEEDIIEAWPTNGRVHQGLYNNNSQWDDYNTYTGVPSGMRTYAMEWGPGYQKYFIDGHLMHQTTNSGAVPTQWQYMLLNGAVADDHAWNFSNSNNNTFEVDYVRLYNYSGSTGPRVANGGFEGSTGFWSTYGNAGTSTTRRTGSNSIRLQSSPEAGAEQTITGLQPNTTYTFSGYVRTDGGGQTAYIGVKNFGGDQILNGHDSATWTQKAITFTTGPTDTSARVFLYKDNTATSVYYDDFHFIKASTLAELSDRSAAPSSPARVSVRVLNSANNWSLSATSDDQGVIANGAITFSGSGSTRTMTFTPAATGSANITVKLTDMFGTSYSESFAVTVLPALVVSGDQSSANQLDSIRLVRNGSNLEIYRNNLSGIPDFSTDYATSPLIAINGVGGDDTLTLDYSGGDPIPASGILWDGGAQTGSDTVVFMGGSGDEAVYLENDLVSINGGSVVMGATEAVSFSMGGGDNTLEAISTLIGRVVLNVDAGHSLSFLESAGLPVNTDAAINGTLEINGMNVGLDALTGAGTINIGDGNPNTLTLGRSNGAGAFSGAINGVGNLTKTGTALLTLSGANTFIGNLRVDNGQLRLAHSQAAGDASNAITLVGNTVASQLQLSGGISAQAAAIYVEGRQTSNTTSFLRNWDGENTLAGDILFGVGGSDYRLFSDSGSMTLTGNIINATGNSTARNLYLQGATGGAISGNIANAVGTTGAVALIKNDAGTWELSGSNTYLGVTTINDGALRAASASALGATSGNTVLASSTGRLELLGGQVNPLIFSAEPITFHGRQPTNLAPAIVNVSGNSAWNGTITFATGGNDYRFQSDAGKVTFNSAITNATGNSSARNIYFQGAGEGQTNGVINNAGGTTGAVTIYKLDGGTWTFNAPNSYSGGTVVSGGQLAIGHGDALASGTLSISVGASVKLLPALLKAVRIASLTLNGTLDITTSALVLDYSGSPILPAIEAAIFSGYNSGLWTGTGITSSTAAANPGTYAVGVIESSDVYTFWPRTWVNQTVADSTTLMIRGTLAADSNLDALVDSIDFNAFIAHYGGSGKRWFTADNDFNNKVNTLDFNRLAGLFGASFPSAPLSASAAASPFSDRQVDDDDKFDLGVGGPVS